VRLPHQFDDPAVSARLQREIAHAFRGDRPRFGASGDDGLPLAGCEDEGPRVRATAAAERMAARWRVPQYPNRLTTLARCLEHRGNRTGVVLLAGDARGHRSVHMDRIAAQWPSDGAGYFFSSTNSEGVMRPSPFLSNLV
jgi:hypothetical protein